MPLQELISDRVTVCVAREPDAGINGYIYTKRYGGRPIVAAPPYCRTAAGRVEVLLTDERVPSWPGNRLSVVTGSPQDPDPLRRRGAGTRAGDRVPRRPHPVGTVRLMPGQQVISTYGLFAVDVTGLEPYPKAGDRSRLEAEAAPVWLGLPPELLRTVTGLEIYRTRG